MRARLIESSPTARNCPEFPAFGSSDATAGMGWDRNITFSTRSNATETIGGGGGRGGSDSPRDDSSGAMTLAAACRGGNSASVRTTSNLDGEAGRLMESGCAATRSADASNGESGSKSGDAIMVGWPCRSYTGTQLLNLVV
jgi:hypothetical protein